MYQGMTVRRPDTRADRLQRRVEYRMITVRTNPGPFQWSIIVASIAIGVTLLVATRATKSTLLRMMPPWVLLVLGIGMAAGGAIALAGMRSQTLAGLLAERVGLSWLLLLGVSYGSLAWAYFGAAAVLQTELLGAFAVSCGWRAWQITRQVRRMRAVLLTATEQRAEGERP